MVITDKSVLPNVQETEASVSPLNWSAKVVASEAVGTAKEIKKA